MWMNGIDPSCTPGPAPSTSRSRSLRPALSRQHRSMDEQEGFGHVDPLCVSTALPSSSRAPLSNPMASSHSYWQNAVQGTTQRGYAFEEEYAQLRQEYAATLDKLNQTMFSIKSFWSPELKRERQLRREEQARLALLERRLGDQHDIYPRSSLDVLESEQVMILQDKIRRLEDALRMKEEQVSSLCLQDGSGSRRALEETMKKVDDRNERIFELEEELAQLRCSYTTKPRDFTEKGPSSHELITLRLKLERSELELSEKKSELATCQTRLRNSEDELNELRSHVQLLKDAATSKEAQSTLLLGDVEALRNKLETRNRCIEQKDEQIEKLQKEAADLRAETVERLDNVRKMDTRTSQLLGRMEQLEGIIREKENEVEKLKNKLAAHPDTHKEREYMARLEEGERERQRLHKAIEEVRIAAEKEHKAQLLTYQSEVERLRQNVETLEKELGDRDVLLESQNEKIGDMGRELTNANKKVKDAMIDKGEDDLRRELESARNEVQKLLRMLHMAEKEKATLNAKCKQLMGEKDSVDELPMSGNANVKQRIHELEEALAESVSITAEREVVLSQHKQLVQQLTSQLGEARRENKELRDRVSAVSGEGHDALIKNINAERKQHMEQLYQLKQEALLSAISEKEAHLTLLQRSNAPQSEVETVRRHKDALMRKLQEENERRSYLHRQTVGRIGPQPIPIGAPSPVIPGAMTGASVLQDAPIVTGAGPMTYKGATIPSDPHREIDANDDGIWA